MKNLTSDGYACYEYIENRDRTPGNKFIDSFNPHVVTSISEFVDTELFKSPPLDGNIRSPNKEVDPNGKNPHSPGAKLDDGKTRVWLMLAGFSRALNEVARITTIGAKKYTPNGWASVEDGENRYMEAFGRHMIDLGKGNRIDDGPGGTWCLHKAQMIWNLLASLELELRKSENEKVSNT